MTTLNSTSILASIIAQNPYHIISIQGQMPMSHAENTYNFDEEEHAEEIDYSLTSSKNQKLFTLLPKKTINLFKSFIHEN